MLEDIAVALNADLEDVNLNHFPDGETYLRFECDLTQRDLIILSSLNDPNPKLLPLLFMADTAKALGAKRVILCAPYLAYMRQDKQFKKGEGITSRYFADIISNHFDALVTVDPHLHRIHDLSEIYRIPTQVIHAAPIIREWVKAHINNPVFFGPDEESKQWVKAVAADAPVVVFEKTRIDSQHVNIVAPDLSGYQSHQPVLIDDIISTAHTMLRSIDILTQQGLKPPLCIGVHGLFSQHAIDSLQHASIARLVTCNTIAHPSNAIELTEPVVRAIRALL